jgi:hypothetical protein
MTRDAHSVALFLYDSVVPEKLMVSKKEFFKHEKAASVRRYICFAEEIFIAPMKKERAQYRKIFYEFA